MIPRGFAHSEIHGSRAMCASPWLIAACHVLRRLPVPRHPPCALTIFLLDGFGTYIHSGALAPVRSDAIFLKKKISSKVTLCSSQGTAGATPGDRTLRASWRGDGTQHGIGGHGPLLSHKKVKGCFLPRKVILPRKEVIQPHVPVRLPCYDFTPLTLHTFGASLLAVGPATSGADDSGGVTGGVYKARERIHRGVLIRDY